MSLCIDRPAQGILRIRIDRPEKRNAVDAQVRAALLEALTTARNDPDCAALVLGGVGGMFSAGGDLPSMVGMSEAQARARMQEGHQLCRLLAGMPVPVVSAAEGFCAGAAVGLALLGDHIVAGRDTRFLFPFLSLGLVPDWGLLRTLPARIGIGAARRILFGGRPLSGEEALRIGVADEYVDEGDVMAIAVDRAVRLARLSPQAFARMKRRLLHPCGALEEDLRREEEDQTCLLLSADFHEGYSAFVEKRAPRFLRDADAA
jgi:2-(1,2-epoxy-1,2-dihydrophenyl)acetyl-CoA isomerase